MQIIQKIITRTLFSLLITQGSFAAGFEDPLKPVITSQQQLTTQQRHALISQHDFISRPEYTVKLEYWCAPSEIHYSNMGFVGIHASNGQEFVTRNWCSGRYLPFVAYGTEKETTLNLTDNMFPLTLTVTHYAAIQNNNLNRDVICNAGRNTKLSDFKVWVEDFSPIVFEIDKEDILDFNNAHQAIRMLICCLEPAEHDKTFLEFFYRANREKIYNQKVQEDMCIEGNGIDEMSGIVGEP